MLGVDVNLWRGDIDWQRVAAWRETRRGTEYRIAFATLKASHGVTGTQAPLWEHWAREAPEMVSSGVPLVGGCHRLLAGDAVAQVNAYRDALAVIGGHVGRIVQLDAEAADEPTIRAWLAEWNRQTNGYPVLGYLPDWKEQQWSDSVLATYGFAAWWASEYVAAEGTALDLMDTITDDKWHAHDAVAPAILQYSSKATVSGVAGPCDVNLYRGTLADLAAIATRNH